MMFLSMVWAFVVACVVGAAFYAFGASEFLQGAAFGCTYVGVMWACADE